MSQHCRPVRVPRFRLVELISRFSSGCKIKGDKRRRVQGDRLAGILEWQSLDIHRPPWTFALTRLPRLKASKSSAPGFYLFEDIVQMNFSLQVIHKLAVLYTFPIWYRHRALP